MNPDIRKKPAFQIPARYFRLLSALVLVLPAGAAMHWLGQDAGRMILWWLALSIPGWLVWPFAASLMPDGDRGYLLAKGLGLALPAFLVWTLSWLHLLPFRFWSIVLVLILTGLACWLNKSNRQAIRTLAAQPSGLAHILGGELLFAIALTVWSFARGLKPELDSLEKFMNIGFMNSLARTDWLPSPDMWFAGESINYYYFGQYAYTYLAKLTQIPTQIAYNLGMATTFALTVILGYSAGSSMIALFRRYDPSIRPAWVPAGGLVSGILTAAGGNGHAFLYAAGSPGHAMMQWLVRAGLAGGDAGKAYWFADATRFIGYNPETADKTIHEFPFYSFLVADLHAHVINLAFVLVLLHLLIVLIDRTRLVRAAASCRQAQDSLVSADDRTWFRMEIRLTARRLALTASDSLLLLSGGLLAIFMMGNYWDFAIYLAAAAWVLIIMNQRAYGGAWTRSGVITLGLQGCLLLVPYLAISQPLAALAGFAVVLVINHYLSMIRQDGLTLAGAQISWLFFLAHALSLPFNLAFEPIAKSVALTVARTPFWQLAVLWTPHTAAALVFGLSLIVLYKPSRIRSFPPRAGNRPGGPAVSLDRWILPVNPADILAVVLAGWAIGLILLPELVYVVDIYSGDYKRANTMFKFTYQAFVLLSVIWGYALARLAGQHKRRKIRLAGILLAILLIIPFWYPALAARQWLGSWTRERYQGLDGLAPLAAKDSPQIPGQAGGELADDLAAISWLNEHVQGHPAILEAHGESYTDYCRISAFTGLPTVMGWETHEWLWRTSKANPNAYGSVVLPRQEDVTELYTTDDQVVRQNLLRQYQIRYVIIGAMERSRYSEDPADAASTTRVREDLFRQLGSVVFQSGQTVIIEISPAG